MTEQSKNRGRQDKVIKDIQEESEAGEVDRRQKGMRERTTETELDRTGRERTPLSHHYGNREQ